MQSHTFIVIIDYNKENFIQHFLQVTKYKLQSFDNFTKI